jgi:adenylate cyclase
MNTFQLFSVIVVSIFLAGCSPKGKTPPKAVKGVLDLRDWDFDSTKGSGTDGIINLDGEWEFYWKEFPVGESLELPADKKRFYSSTKGMEWTYCKTYYGIWRSSRGNN